MRTSGLGLAIAACVLAAAIPAAAQSSKPAKTAKTAQPAKPPQQANRADIQKRLDARFVQIDTDKDGVLTRAEIDAARTSFLSVTSSAIGRTVKREFAATDKNKDGKATLEEMTGAVPPEGKEGAEKVFHKLDANKDKAVTLAEFAAAAPKPALGGTDAFLKRFDADGDGKVTAAEYRAPGLAAFDMLDSNKDGKVTVDERRKAAASAGR